METTGPVLVTYFARAMRWFDDGLQQKLQEKGVLNTTRTQSAVIGNLVLGETRPSRLARNIGITPQAMSQVLGDLTDVGLISVVPDEVDGRARVVKLTEAGETYLEIVRPILSEMEAALEARFGRPVIDVLRMVLRADWEGIAVNEP